MFNILYVLKLVPKIQGFAADHISKWIFGDVQKDVSMGSSSPAAKITGQRGGAWELAIDLLAQAQMVADFFCSGRFPAISDFCLSCVDVITVN